MRVLKDQTKRLIIETLKLDETCPDGIDSDKPLFVNIGGLARFIEAYSVG